MKPVETIKAKLAKYAAVVLSGALLHAGFENEPLVSEVTSGAVEIAFGVFFAAVPFYLSVLKDKVVKDNIPWLKK